MLATVMLAGLALRIPRTLQSGARLSVLEAAVSNTRGREVSLGFTGCKVEAIRKFSVKRRRRDHYEVLGVAKEATVAEVKLAFFRKVKAVHPDTREQKESKEDHEAFLELVEAYETLSCVRKRRVYDSQVCSPFASNVDNDDDDFEMPFGRRNPSHGRAKSPYEPWKPGWDNRDLAMYRHGMSLFESIRAEFHEAMVQARIGPQVPEFASEGLEMMFPWAFEAEVRSDSSHAHILHVVSGRQLLGYVETSSDPLLHISPSGEVEVGENNTNEAGKASASSNTRFASTDVDFDLIYQGKHVARAHRRGKRIIVFGTEMSDDGSQNDDAGEDLIHLATIEPRGEVSEKGLLRSLGMPKLPYLSTRVPAPPPVENPFKPRAWPAAFDILDSAMKPTHRVVQWSAMGVDNVFWFHGEHRRKSIAGDVNVANCAIKVSRAWTLSEKLWLFEPRASSHANGSWYFEVARPTLTEDQIAVAAQNFLQRSSRSSTDETESRVAPKLSHEVKLSWAIEKAAANERKRRGAVDPRVAILFAAFSTE